MTGKAIHRQDKFQTHTVLELGSLRQAAISQTYNGFNLQRIF